jgi:glycolate oxidase iron-sulfur subunit
LTDCAKCGACITVCPVYQVTGRESLTARGKLHLFEHLASEEKTAAYANILSACLLCGACDDVCPRQVDIHHLVVDARRKQPSRTTEQTLLYKISQKALATPAILAGISKAAQAAGNLFLKNLPEKSGLRYKLSFLDLDKWQTTPARSSAQNSITNNEAPPQTAYFAGCFARHLNTGITSDTFLLLKATGQSPPSMPDSQVCCGLAAWSAGDTSTAKKLAQINIEAFEETNLPILASCASCYTHLKKYPEIFKEDNNWRFRAETFADRVREFSTFFLAALSEPQDIFINNPTGDTQKILYHDPCHLRFRAKITKAPRQLINLVPGKKLVSLPHGSQCCGQGGLFDILHPDLSKKIMGKLLDDYQMNTADTIVTTCTGCLIQWRRAISAGRHATDVIHLATLLAENLNKNGSG